MITRVMRTSIRDLSWEQRCCNQVTKLLCHWAYMERCDFGGLSMLVRAMHLYNLLCLDDLPSIDLA